MLADRIIFIVVVSNISTKSASITPGTVNFAQAKIIDDGSNSGTNTYSISDTAANLAAGTVTSVTAINGAQSVTSATANATQAAKLAAISKPDKIISGLEASKA